MKSTRYTTDGEFVIYGEKSPVWPPGATVPRRVKAARRVGGAEYADRPFPLFGHIHKAERFATRDEALAVLDAYRSYTAGFYFELRQFRTDERGFEKVFRVCEGLERTLQAIARRKAGEGVQTVES